MTDARDRGGSRSSSVAIAGDEFINQLSRLGPDVRLATTPTPPLTMEQP